VLEEETDTIKCPDWYAMGQAAKYWGVSPQAMMEMPFFWRVKAHIAMKAEYQAQKIKQQHNQ